VQTPDRRAGVDRLPDNRAEAQRRADQIRTFEAELDLLEQEGGLVLTTEQRATLARHHSDLLSDLARRFDVDTSPAARQMSLGMRIVSFLGALALSAAIFFFFYRFWGLLSVPAQVGILVAAPLALLPGVELAARRERTLYFASILALVGFAAFVLDLYTLGRIFSITPTENALLVWGGLAMVLAYGYGLRLALVAGSVCLVGYLTTTMGSWSDIFWLSSLQRPENFIAAGLLLCGAAALPHRRYPEFPPTYRVLGLLAVFLAVLVLSYWGRGSYLMLPDRWVEGFYQSAGFVLAAFVIGLGIRKHWRGVTNLGSTFFVIYLYTKLFDWWWDWLPKYVFFLLLGLIAVGLLLILRRMRTLVREMPS
jgi:uncharacterized membrane protein